MARNMVFATFGFIVALLLFSLYSNLSSKSPVNKISIGKKIKIADCDISKFSISPEGERVAYKWENNLWTINIYGETLQLMDVGIEDRILTFVWSPTEDKILCEVSHESQYELWRDMIWILDVLSKNRCSLLGRNPSWSPDGEKIAYIVDGDIWIVNKKGDLWSRKRVTDVKKEHIFYAWSSDGKKIAFTVSSKELWILDLATGEKRRLAYEPLHSFQWLPGGEKIIYHSRRGSVWEVGLDGLGLKQFIANFCEATWSPDGKRGAKVVFNLSGDGGYENRLVTIDVEKRKIISSILIAMQSVPGVPYQFKKVLWFPNGRMILLLGKKKGQIGLYVADIEKGKTQLLIDDEKIWNYALSPDGRRIFFVVEKEDKSELWMATVEGLK